MKNFAAHYSKIEFDKKILKTHCATYNITNT